MFWPQPELYAEKARRNYPQLEYDMNYREVIKSWGAPTTKQEYETSRIEKWLFGSHFVTFKNGKVVSWTGSEQISSDTTPLMDNQRQIDGSSRAQLELISIDELLAELSESEETRSEEAAVLKKSKLKNVRGLKKSQGKIQDKLSKAETRLGGIKPIPLEELREKRKQRIENGYVKTHKSPEKYFKKQEEKKKKRELIAAGKMTTYKMVDGKVVKVEGRKGDEQNNS